MRRCLRCEHEWDGDGWTCRRCGFAPETMGGYPAFAPALAAENADYPSGYFEVLSDVDGTHFWFRARGAMVTWAMRRHFAAPRAVMEIGCGTGGILARIRDAFAEAALTGSDIHTAALPYAASRLPGAELLQMDATAIPYTNEFDVVAACDVIEHIECDDLALAAIHRALRPGGGIVLTVPQDPRLWSAWDEAGGHKRRYRRAELVERVRGAGFTVERVLSMSSLLYPLMRLRRQRYAGDASDELRIPAPLNFALGRVMDVERFLLRRGADFPFGGSLLLVGRRA
jgi:SAM-dependent methyltransferase